MNTRAILSLAAVALLGIAVFFALNGHGPKAAGGSMAVAPSDSQFFGSVESASAQSITVKSDQEGTKTFRVAASTMVVSTMPAGKVAPAITGIMPGARVVVEPEPADASTARSVQVQMPPVVPQSALSESAQLVSLGGPVLSHSASSITIRTESGPTTLTLSKDVQVISNVVAGTAGKSLSDIVNNETPVIIQAVHSGSAYTAYVVQILVPLPTAFY